MSNALTKSKTSINFNLIICYLIIYLNYYKMDFTCDNYFSDQGKPYFQFLYLPHVTYFIK